VIYVLDSLEVRFGRLNEVESRITSLYRPLVEPLGLRFCQKWIAPAVEVIDEPIELLLLWSLSDLRQYWRMRLKSAGIPEVQTFWRDLEPLLVGRTRRLMCDPDDATIVR
jgi:hypothetical protein